MANKKKKSRSQVCVAASVVCVCVCVRPALPPHMLGMQGNNQIFVVFHFFSRNTQRFV